MTPTHEDNPVVYTPPRPVSGGLTIARVSGPDLFVTDPASIMWLSIWDSVKHPDFSERYIVVVDFGMGLFRIADTQGGDAVEPTPEWVGSVVKITKAMA